MLKAYLKYRKSRVNAHGIHSPFVFALYNAVIKLAPQRNTQKVERYRKKLYQNDAFLRFEDFGAGSRKGGGDVRKISTIAKNAGIKRKYGRLLAQLTDHYGIEKVLELGTSLGLGSHYLLSGNDKLELISLEGCNKVAYFAEKKLQESYPDRAEVIVGEFSASLSNSRFSEAKFDLIYIDGNHQMKPTLDYFEFALNHIHDESVIIFDDVHWSKEMEQAWGKICKDERIHVSMDLFQFGIVCVRKGQRKQHFVLKY